MYNAHALFHQIDRHTALILTGFTVAMVFQWIWLIDCVLVAKRERRYSMPLFCTFFWFAHDTGCVVRFDDWFNKYHHWFLECFWFGLLTAVILEVIFLAQAFKYGREEIAPDLSERAFAALMLAGIITAEISWAWFKTVLHDPLYQLSPTITMVSYVVFGAILLLNRRSRAGQTPRMWWAFAGMCTAWWITTVAWYGHGFDSWEYLAAGVISVGGGAAIAYTIGRMPVVAPAQPDIKPAAAPAVVGV